MSGEAGSMEVLVCMMAQSLCHNNMSRVAFILEILDMLDIALHLYIRLTIAEFLIDSKFRGLGRILYIFLNRYI